MDKFSLISRFAENPEEKIILSHILDLAERSYNRSTVESGDFLPDALKIRAEQMLKLSPYENYFFWGGYEQAERTCPVFFTDYCDSETIKQSPALAEIVFAKAELDKFNKDAEISHRDVLGSLMGLGIERDTIGDIAIYDGYAVFILKSAIEPFIKENLKKIGRYPVNIVIYNSYEIERIDDFEEHFDTVASLRLDAVVASLFSTSRAIASSAIEAGLISVNGAIAKKCDATVTESSKISYRGHGRAEIEKVDGISKKGRTRILFKKWK